MVVWVWKRVKTGRERDGYGSGKWMWWLEGEMGIGGGYDDGF